jgi:hypothetical protein
VMVRGAGGLLESGLLASSVWRLTGMRRRVGVWRSGRALGGDDASRRLRR